MLKYTALVVGILALSACTAKRHNTLFYKGLERMLKSESERIPLDLTAPDAIKTLNKYVVGEKPTYAILSCTPNSPVCEEALTLLKAYRVEFSIESITSNVDKAILNYDRISEMPCEASVYGCSQALNAFSMIDDPRTILTPNPIDYASSRRFTSRIASEGRQDK